MFCILRKRKLYDLLEGNLSKDAAEKIKAHLEKCANCAVQYRQMQQILSLAKEEKAPRPSDEFWMNFNRELEQKLAPVAREFKFRRLYLPGFNLKPALAVSTVIILALCLSFSLFGGLPTAQRITSWNDSSLLDEIEMLEELTEEYVALEDDEFLLDELDLIEELG